MAANNIYIQVDFNSQNAQQNVNALNQGIANTGTTAEKSSKQATQALSTVQVSVQQTTRAFGELTTALAGLGLTRMIAGIVQSASEYSRARQAITLFAGSAEDARKAIEQIRVLAAQSPFHFQDLQESGRQLLGFGIAAKNVPTVLRAISDQVAAMGGSMENVTGIVHLMGRIMEKDVVGAMDLMRMLPAQGVPIMRAFQAELSKSLNMDATREDVQRAIKEGLLDPLQAIRVIVENMGKTGIGKLLVDAATAFKNLGDAAQYAMNELFGDQGFGPAFAKLAGDIEKVLGPIGGLIKALESLDEPTKDAIVKWGAIGAAVLAAGTAFAALAAIFSPLIAVIGGLIALLPEILTVVGALAGIGAVLYKTVPQVKTAVDGLKGQFDELAAKGKDFTAALDKLFHPDALAKGDILDREKQQQLLQTLLEATIKTADSAKRVLLEGLSSPVEAVQLKWNDLFAQLEDKMRLLRPELKQAVRDVLSGGETAELAAARFKEEKQAIDELAKYQAEKVKGSYDAQIAYIEAMDAQGTQKRVAAIDKITELRIASAQKVAAVEDDHLSELYQKQVKLLEDPALGLSSTQILAAETNLYNEMTAKRQVIDEKAFDDTQKYRLEGWKKANDAIIEDQKRVFEEFQNLFDQLFDAFTGKSKDIGKAVADVLKKEVLGEARNIFSTLAAQGATAATGYGVPEADFRRTGGVLSAILMRGGAPRPPLPPPELWNPARGEAKVDFPEDGGGKGGANRLMASADTYHGATVIFAQAVAQFAGATQSSQGSADRLANTADDFSDAFDKASQSTGVSGGLLRAMAQTESNFNPFARSSAGAMGIMQLLPGTARDLGVTDPFNPQQNIMGGAKYMAQLLSKYHGNVGAALAAYNMGPNAYTRAMARGQDLPYETKQYVQKIQALVAAQQYQIGPPPAGVAPSPLAGLGTLAVSGPAALPASTLGTAAQAAAYTGFTGTPADLNLPFDQKGWIAPQGLPATTGLDIMGLPAQTRNDLQTLAKLAPIAGAYQKQGQDFWKKAMGWFGGSYAGSGGLSRIGTNISQYGAAFNAPGATTAAKLQALSTGPLAGTAAGPAAGAVGMMLATAGIFGESRGTAAGVAEATAGGFLAAGPIGAAVGFGIGIGEVAAGVETPRRQVKRLASSLYHISINNATADAIVNLAQQSFGGNIAVAMRSPQVRQMLGVYAAGTGQANQFPAGLGQAHGASLVEAGGTLQQQATYQYGQAFSYGSDLPIYGGAPTHILSAPGGGMQLSLNIGGQDAASFLAGNVVSPSMVQQQYATAMQNSNGRVPQALMMSEPGTIVG
jgi:hypothetical protein